MRSSARSDGLPFLLLVKKFRQGFNTIWINRDAVIFFFNINS